MKTVIASLLAVAAALSALAIADESIDERLKPAGELCMAGDECAAAVVEVAASSGPRSGDDVYGSKCATCHATGAAGAPKLGDAGAWAPRVGQGMDILYAHALEGFNGMPAKGLCFDCSDDEIKAAVDHMVENSK
ncbi:c-type cytochrome [Agaribacterium haliotis]|uniref:c-type cytochrome n=1 Tax=Agaribacterium haliotis TaxID=2013869 RepID=UPI000BB57D9F|nr:cytochrome c5 family protein [Agaribacterium haliotis]